MLFNSTEYLVFFLITLTIGWITVGRPNFRLWFLLFASYYFYVSNNHWLIILFLFVTLLVYVCALQMEKAQTEKSKKIYLWISVAGNLSILGFFKYFNFFATSVSDTLANIGYEASWVDLNIALPVGISFYTFQSISYGVDVYRGEIKAERSWKRFSFFISYFPQLVAGPIVRPKEFLPQLDVKPKLTKADFEFALVHIFRGLFKKIVLADILARFVSAGFTGQADTLTTWTGVLAFTFQIYFDFSGYSDLAIGCSRLMGYKIPENFRRPYMSTSITDFWRRWHISLSSWLRDYLYIPLGGNRQGARWKTFKNLMITMLLGGLWHGAAWHFIIWGGLQGLMLSVERALGISRKRGDAHSLNGLTILRILVVFILVNVSWIVFRADNNEIMWSIFRSMFILNGDNVISYGTILVMLIAVAGMLNQLIDEYWRFEEWYFRLPVFAKSAFYATVIVLVIIFNSGEAAPFIYFQF